ncbi:MAG: hypothetical protein Q8N09_10360, partial [Thermodesulfovibrionia bacterium]|nr:hypothetical protein [Thermodesulfovibrionia bacterium]
ASCFESNTKWLLAKNSSLIKSLPAPTDNNGLAQRPTGKQKLSTTESLDLGVFVSQAHNVST